MISLSVGDTGQYLSIATGYHKGKNPENADKWKIYIVFWGFINQYLETTASHFKPIMKDWNPDQAPVGLIYTWGGWDTLDWYDYLVTASMEQLSDNNLYEKWKWAYDAGLSMSASGWWSIRAGHCTAWGATFHVGF